MHPEKVCQLIGACAILHNIAIAFNEPMEDEEGDEDDQLDVQEYQGRETGHLIRDHIANTFFKIHVMTGMNLHINHRLQ